MKTMLVKITPSLPKLLVALAVCLVAGPTADATAATRPGLGVSARQHPETGIIVTSGVIVQTGVIQSGVLQKRRPNTGVIVQSGVIQQGRPKSGVIVNTGVIVSAGIIQQRKLV